jgi:vitamin B12 transporter
VVNLITRKQWTPGLHADANIWTGTLGSGTSLLGQQLFFNATAASGLYANLEAVNSRIRGLDATVDTVSQTSVYKNRDKDGMEALDLFGKVGFANRELDAYVAFKRHRQEKDIDKAAYRDDDNATLDFTRNLLTYGASYRFSDRLRLKFVGGYSTMKRTAVDDSSAIDASGKTDQTYSRNAWSGTMSTNELQAIIRDSRFEVVLGGGVYAETMSSQSYFFSNSIFGPFEFSTNLDTLGLSATVKHLFGRVDLNGSLLHSSFQQWNLGLGARLTHHNAFGYHRSVEVNPSYRVSERGLLYALYSMGFSAPSLYQLYAPDRDFSSGIARGNNGLQPESSSSYELGMKFDLSEDVGMSASYFHTVVNNSIEYVYLWDRNIPIQMLGSDFRRNDFRGDTYLNLGRQTTDGFEFTVHARLNEVWSLSGNLSLVSGKLRYDPSNLDQQKTQGHHVQLYSNGAFLTREVETKELVRRPNTANLAITYTPTARWMVRLAARHAGARPDVYYDAQRGPYGALGTQPVDAYTVVDLFHRYAVSERLSISARVENVFNTEYLEINGFTTRGRGFFVSARYLFDHQF